MINISTLLTSIKMSLGIYQIKLPFNSVDDALMDVIRIKTIPIFSVYYPYSYRKYIKLNDLVCIDKNYEHSIYRVPESFLGDRKLITINNIEPRRKPIGGNYLDPSFGFGSYNLIGELALTQTNQDIISVITPKFTWHFEEPNIVHMFNVVALYGECEFDFGLEHDPNLATVPSTQYGGFYDLVLLDIKEFLYNALKHYNEVSSAFGTVNLRIDEWSDAASKREDLLREWDSDYHLARKSFYIR